MEAYHQAATNEIIMHCKRELMHRVLGLLFDEEFADAFNDAMHR